MSIQPYGAPGCWSRQFEEDDHECNGCTHRSSCKQQYLNSRGMAQAPPPPPPGGWQQPAAGQRVHIPVIQPNQQGYYPQPNQPPPAPAQVVPAPQPQTQRFWQTPQAGFFEPHEGEGTGERLAKNASLAMGASLFETLGSFFRTWRWPKKPGN